MRIPLTNLANPWVWRMAWRDSRTSRRRLLLFSTSITLGIAALVAIESFGQNLRDNVDGQTKALLGADLLVSSRQPFTPRQEAFLQELGGRQAEGVTFSSMLWSPGSELSRLVQAVAVDGAFPFYGELQTEPPGAAAAFQAGEGFLLEPALMTQLEVAAGEQVRLGEWTGQVLGSLIKAPGTSIGFASIAPRVYLPYARVPDTKLVQARSLVRYQRFFQFSPGTDVESLVKSRDFGEERLQYDTVERRKRSLGRAMTNLYHFLNLSGFIALLLGSVGIGTAIHVHVKQKLHTVAILRCLGATASQMFPVYLIQALALGLCGTLLGALLGLLLQRLLPGMVAGLLPFSIEVSISWLALLQAIAVGFGISFLFALLPLLTVRRVSPLAAIRSEYAGPGRSARDPLRWLVFAAITAAITSFAVSQTRDWEVGAGFAGALGVALLMLGAVAKLIMILARRLVPATLPYVWRQGLANLYRPNNRTHLLMLSLGLGTFLVLSLYLTHHILLTQLLPKTQTNRPNAILFEIYEDQKEAVVDLVRAMKLPVLQDVPVVSMRLSSVKGLSVEELLRDDNRGIPRWALRREYRSTYRDHLVDSEELSQGAWISQFTGDLTSTVPVSLEEGIAEELGVSLGDRLVFDVQGLPITTEVASLRRVDWQRMQPNFFVVFPPGSLAGAPSFHILATHVPSAGVSAELQRAVVKQFPNVSAIDLTLVLQTLDNILSRVSFVVRFMAMLTVATGLLVLAGAVLTGKYQRIQESVLLRTLGATRRQIQRILLAEYLFLGLFAGLTGALLSIGGSWALAKFVFKIGYSLAWGPLVVTLVLVTGLVILIGLLTNRGVVQQPPLQVLRAEGAAAT